MLTETLLVNSGSGPLNSPKEIEIWINSILNYINSTDPTRNLIRKHKD